MFNYFISLFIWVCQIFSKLIHERRKLSRHFYHMKILFLYAINITLKLGLIELSVCIDSLKGLAYNKIT